MTGADYFASDTHLSEARPDITDRFLRFLNFVKLDGKRLFLLGDIFDLWVGPKQRRLSYVRPIVRQLRALTAAGIEVVYVAGNRDFNFDARVNGGPAKELPDVHTMRCGDLRLYLTHGDLYCTGDRAYRRARGIGRSAPLRFVFAKMPLRISTFLSQGYRRLSSRVVRRKSRREKAVDFSRVRATLRSGYDTVVCGHVHHGARYTVDLGDGRTGEFITLGDWNRAGVYLVGRDGVLELKKFK
ncbi:MAG: UDP-2,3-diacylglucosamine diphosphatase [Planctomycetota bacterium]